MPYLHAELDITGFDAFRLVAWHVDEERGDPEQQNSQSSPEKYAHGSSFRDVNA